MLSAWVVSHKAQRIRPANKGAVEKEWFERDVPVWDQCASIERIVGHE